MFITYFQPYSTEATYQGIFYNLVVAGIGNFIGACCVSGINYLISRKIRDILIATGILWLVESIT